MDENAELWIRRGQERVALEGWLHYNKIEYNKNASIEELIQLYRDVECGKYVDV